MHPSNAECFFLRLLLVSVQGPKSFRDLKTIDGYVCKSFRESCQKRGFLDDDNHWDITLKDTVLTGSPSQLRNLFAIMLVFCFISNPLELWNKYKHHFCEDLIHYHEIRHNAVRGTITLDRFPEIENECLVMLQDKVLLAGGKQLDKYDLPQPNVSVTSVIDKDILREKSYVIDKDELAFKQSQLLSEQRHAFNLITNSVDKALGHLYFLDAPGGTGKTFLLNLLLQNVRSKDKIALAVASSGIAATLLVGGRTAHSTFKIPLDMSPDEPTCGVSKQSARGKLLKNTNLIVFDEVTMCHRKALEAHLSFWFHCKAFGWSFCLLKYQLS